ncbi:hypothetical protein EYF80_029383 [Liparis tanakae]|uniref:Uncharacterized protein n=1 Tax=Liparis tanakae TaxID=230148 RepID=A0A4Z2H6H3_9TELE|nr:hypothetical protein EYF80_029383 [Liparis tanakae]
MAPGTAVLPPGVGYPEPEGEPVFVRAVAILSPIMCRGWQPREVLLLFVSVSFISPSIAPPHPHSAPLHPGIPT